MLQKLIHFITLTIKENYIKISSRITILTQLLFISVYHIPV